MKKDVGGIKIEKNSLSTRHVLSDQENILSLPITIFESFSTRRKLQLEERNVYKFLLPLNIFFPNRLVGLNETLYISENTLCIFYIWNINRCVQERLKREAYQHDLRLQIEEKRHLAAMREEQERRERDLENRRLEQQLMRMREEQYQEEQRRQRRNELVSQ